MKTGLQFENVLCRGVLEYVDTLPNGAPEYRYAMHELIEEGQHQLMFQEFVNRSGIDVDGMPLDAKIGSRFVVLLGRVFPELFFMFVLGGEDPIDHVQREALQGGRQPPAARGDHADPRHRGGSPPELRPPLPQGRGGRHGPGQEGRALRSAHR